MRKIVMVHGLLAGGLQCLLLLVPFALLDFRTIDSRYELLEKFGYTVMILSMGVMFLGVRRYRDAALGGVISFGRALAAGFYTVLVAAGVFGAAVWVLYRFVKPEFLGEFLRHHVEGIKASGRPPAEIVAQLEQLAAQKDTFLNPAVQASVMFVTVAAVGIPIALLTAAILKKKPA